jgi:hypothetical protein
MGSFDENDCEKAAKIITNIAKEVRIDRKLKI